MTKICRCRTHNLVRAAMYRAAVLPAGAQ